MQPLSDSSNLLGIQAPRQIWDRISRQYGIWASAHWNSASAITRDANYTRGPVGKTDAAGLVFSYFPTLTPIKAWYLQTSDQNGERFAQNFNPTVPQSTDGRLAILFRHQDNYLGVNNGVYDWWNMEVWVWYEPSYRGEAYNWATAGLSSRY